MSLSLWVSLSPSLCVTISPGATVCHSPPRPQVGMAGPLVPALGRSPSHPPCHGPGCTLFACLPQVNNQIRNSGPPPSPLPPFSHNWTRALTLPERTVVTSLLRAPIHRPDMSVSAAFSVPWLVSVTFCPDFLLSFEVLRWGVWVGVVARRWGRDPCFSPE